MKQRVHVMWSSHNLRLASWKARTPVVVAPAAVAGDAGTRTTIENPPRTAASDKRPASTSFRVGIFMASS
jgi:hypothetical protein